MSLRKSTLIAIVSVFIGLMAVILLSLRFTLLSYFDDEEQRSMQLTVKRFENALAGQYKALERTGKDWAYWDDTYNYILGKMPEYKPANLEKITFVNLSINLLVLTDVNGNLIYGEIYDPESDSLLGVPDIVLANLSPDRPLYHNANSSEILNGLVATDPYPLLVVSLPVLTSNAQGPTAGTLVIGRYLNQDIKAEIESLTDQPFEYIAYDAASNDPQFAIALPGLSTKSTTFVQANDKEIINGYKLLADINGQPAFIVHTERARSIHQSGVFISNYLITVMVMVGITFSVMLFYLIEFLVLRRVSRLNSDVKVIGEQGNLSGRVKTTGHDELTSLGTSINEMLALLQQSQHRLEESEVKFRSLVNSMKDVVFSVNKNYQLMEIFGGSDEDLIQTLREGVSPDRAEDIIHLDMMKKALEGETQIYDWSLTTNGRKAFYQNTVSPLRNAGGEIIGAVGVGRDISTRINLENELRQRVEELTVLYKASQTFLSEIEPENTMANICQIAAEYLAYPAAWLYASSTDDSLLTPVAGFGILKESLPALSLTWRADPDETPAARALRTAQISLVETTEPSQTVLAIPLMTSFESPYVLCLGGRNNGPLSPAKEQWLKAFCSLAEMALQNAWLYQQVRDGRERLQSLSTRLVEVQEDERRGLALELHDEIGQMLTGMKLLLDTSVKLSQEKQAENIQKAQSLVNELIRQVRELSLDLHPSMIDDLGLLPTLIWLFNRYTNQTSIQVVLKHDNIEDQRFSPQAEITTYRIIQEALTNVARYARVDRVDIRLWYKNERLNLQVEDKGVGFSPKAVMKTGNSRGLVGMFERINFIGGQITIESQAGKGTFINVELPTKIRSAKELS